jgi:D-lactate dehydrogenase
VAESPAPLGKVVYFPSCATRMFGASKTGYDLLATTDAMLALLRRASYEPVVPEHLNGRCCGQPFLSKGFPEDAERVGGKLQTQLSALSSQSACSIVTDASTCAKHMNEHHGDTPVADSAEFLLAKVLPHLTITQPLPVLAIHHNCSAQRLKEQASIEALASAIAQRTAVLSSITCCGYAGDKGLFFPELNAHATRFAKNDIPPDCTIGVSTVSTCASGLSERTGIPFVSFASLLEYVSRPL